MTFQDMNVSPILITLGPEEDELKLGMVFSDMNVTEILVRTDPEEDYMNLGMVFVDMDVIPKLITTYSPDQGLIMSVDLDTANCSLD
jgi:hypothetical protein